MSLNPAPSPGYLFDHWEENSVNIGNTAPLDEFLTHFGKNFRFLRPALAHFFTKEPVRTPDDMKKLKMFVWAGDDRYVELWKQAGFNPVPLPSTEIATAERTISGRLIA